ncbi:hypothetical protein PPERSA_04790 [Pseudocohnilembus persalinus]|uniref:Transmembrane protein n=1 Tax=Pseudocohnilembus persalinus TaxID=266149 RepID=A0A0V0Q9E3_PSEPJ|nr:hypothetical protein PPERSA_04790 [Pseudocohnilembus persalinus]|eukprot:KRW98857.1 hypothetical protein PPERSA_04790 [Pseudocohnilembus persalinus]
MTQEIKKNLEQPDHKMEESDQNGYKFQFPKLALPDNLNVPINNQAKKFQKPNSNSNQQSKSLLNNILQKSYIKKILKYSNVIILIGQTVFHYFDVITDFFLIFSAYEIRQNTQLEKYKETWNNVFIVLISVLVIERYKTFTYLCELAAKQNEFDDNGQQQNDDLVEQSNRKQEDNSKKKVKFYLSFCDRIKALFLTISYLDFIYIVMFKTSLSNKFDLVKKGILKMYFENVVYQLIGLNVIIYQINIGETVKTSVLLSVLSSMCSTSYVVYQTYIIRTRYSKVFEEKKNQPFNEFSTRTKKERYWKIFITILLSPLLAVYGLLLFMAPIKSDRLPFTPQIQENWLYNFFSSGYTLMVKQVLTTFWIWGCYKFIFLGIDYNESKYPNGEGIENIVDPESPIRLIFYIAFVAFIVNTIQSLMYLYENLIHKFLIQNEANSIKEDQLQLIRRQNKLQNKIGKYNLNDLEIYSEKQQILEQLRCSECLKKHKQCILTKQKESQNQISNSQLQIQCDAQESQNSNNFMALQKVQSLYLQKFQRSVSQTPSKLLLTIDQASQSNNTLLNTKLQKLQEQVKNDINQNTESQICTNRIYNKNNVFNYEEEEEINNNNDRTNNNQISLKEVSFDMEALSSPQAYKKNGILNSAIEKVNNSFLSRNCDKEKEHYSCEISEREQQTNRPIIQKQVIPFHNGDIYLKSPVGYGENMFDQNYIQQWKNQQEIK